DGAAGGAGAAGLDPLRDRAGVEDGAVRRASGPRQRHRLPDRVLLPDVQHEAGAGAGAQLPRGDAHHRTGRDRPGRTPPLPLEARMTAQDRAVQISLRNISKSFRTGRRLTPVIDDMSLDIHAGEIVGLLGPSGCGKSTLLNIVAGLDRAYEGHALIAGKPLIGQIEAGFRVAYVFQEPRLLRWKTLRQNIE